MPSIPTGFLKNTTNPPWRKAGYPSGFETNCVASTASDLELLQIIKAYFMDIGVDMEIRTMDAAAFQDLVTSGKHDALAMSGWQVGLPPAMARRMLYTYEKTNITHHGDTAFDKLVEDFDQATTMDEAKQLSREADRYYLQSHWHIVTFPYVDFNVWQPYLKGYLGE